MGCLLEEFRHGFNHGTNLLNTLYLSFFSISMIHIDVVLTSDEVSNELLIDNELDSK
jgi:hypothetical protein